MRRPLSFWIAFLAFAALAVPAAASAKEQYYIGEGEDYDTKVSFRLVDGELKHGLVEFEAPTQGPVGPSEIQGFGVFRATSLDNKFHFRCEIDREGRGLTRPGYHFKFAGKLASREAVGRASARTENGLIDWRMRRTQWKAKSVSKEEYESFVGIGNALADSEGRPGCD